MLFPIDRLQFIDNTLIAYEFIDISDKRLNKDGNNHKFMRFKINYLSETFKDNFYLIGDNYSDYEEYSGIMSTRVMLCAAHQANIVLRIILGEEK